MSNKIQATEEKLEALKHPEGQESPAQASEAKTESAGGGRIENLKEALSEKLTDLKTAVQTQVEELKENPKVKAAADDVTTWVKEKAERAQELAPKVVARVKKAIKAKSPVKAVSKLKVSAKKAISKKSLLKSKTASAKTAAAKGAALKTASIKNKKQAKSKSGSARLH